MTQLRSSIIAAKGARLDAIAGSLKTVAAVGDTWRTLDDSLDTIALPRLRALAQLRAQGLLYDQVAVATEMSKGRAAQLVRAARDLRPLLAPGRSPSPAARRLRTASGGPQAKSLKDL